MKALDSELFKDAPSNGILKFHQSMVCENQNPTLPLNRAQEEENINKRKKSMVEIATWGGGGRKYVPETWAFHVKEADGWAKMTETIRYRSKIESQPRDKLS